jgi:hypothetical protein
MTRGMQACARRGETARDLGQALLQCAQAFTKTSARPTARSSPRPHGGAKALKGRESFEASEVSA